MTKVALVLNIPTPYRVPVFQRVSAAVDIDLHLIYCSHTEPDREWVLERSTLSEIFLKDRMIRWRGRFIHFGAGVWRELRRLNPDVVITGGYNPTHLIAFMYCVLTGVRHISNTDGDVESENGLSVLHRAVRRAVSTRTQAYIGPSDSSLRLFESWGVSSGRVFKAPLSVDNEAFDSKQSIDREFDVLFCGRLTDVKDPIFALAVSAEIAEKLNRKIRVLILGSGPLADAVDAMAATLSSIIVTRPGFVQPDEIASWFQRCRLFLFPTDWDPWGLVVNEACAAGLPVLATPNAGAARELVKSGMNGYIVPKSVQLWADLAAKILDDSEVWTSMSETSRTKVERHTHQASAEGYLAAIRSAISESELN
jgi:glycosyltransferase involved in cell wall biosynthesis